MGSILKRINWKSIASAILGIIGAGIAAKYPNEGGILIGGTIAGVAGKWGHDVLKP